MYQMPFIGTSYIHASTYIECDACPHDGVCPQQLEGCYTVAKDCLGDNKKTRHGTLCRDCVLKLLTPCEETCTPIWKETNNMWDITLVYHPKDMICPLKRRKIKNAANKQ